MPKKMLIDATHSEETRVVVVDGNKVEEFDFESLNKRQLSGNIYLAKITRVEPSLQAAFVDYGGNRHGFLAFSEIHPDYYQIPVADREALIAEQEAEEEARRAEEEEEAQPKPRRGRSRSRSRSAAAKDGAPTDETVTAPVEADAQPEATDAAQAVEPTPEAQPAAEETPPVEAVAEGEATVEASAEPAVEAPAQPESEAAPTEEVAVAATEEAVVDETSGLDESADLVETPEGKPAADEADSPAPEAATEAGASDDAEEVRAEQRRRRPKARRYKIQEVVKVRQIMLIQVVKEERGNKGAALTTYLSLAGRYCVLMPNTARGGGISRKITNAVDRKKLKDIASEIEVPKGAGLIIRTAGAKRTRTEIKRDYEYLIRQWQQIRDLTMKSIAPQPIYEEGSLIKRSIRDLYSRDIDEIFVEGADGYREAKEYMRMLMPSHAKNVKLYQDPVSLFGRFQVESYLGQMFNPTVQLKSGGYLVIGITEALVAVDVNSGRSTKEGSIEDTALKTNLEAADEVARQLRLRDLAGLIVIDFIDMDERRNNAAVEKRMKDALKPDRARIQVGRISSFGLMEMSRQRLRPGMLEASTQACPHCHGTGLVRSNDSLGLSIIRELEEEGVRQRCKEIVLTAPVDVANYLLNSKREHIALIETRYGIAIQINGDPHLISPEFKVERFKTSSRVVTADPMAGVIQMDGLDLEEDYIEEAEEIEEETPRPEVEADDQPKKKKRRRRRRGGRGRDGESDGENGESTETTEAASGDAATAEEPAADDAAPKKTRSRSRTRTRKPAKPATDEADAVEAPVEEATTETVEAPVAEEAPAEKPAPKPRRSRARKKPVEAEVVVEAPTPEAVAEPVAEEPAAPVTEPTAVEAEVTAAAAAEAPAEVAPAESTAPVEPEPVKSEVVETPVASEPAAEELAAEETAETKSDDDRPKRRGWWARTIGS
ncbi:ribonuclease E [Monaibacterium marinum]|uniref:Ribonuclease E n=1 Tax=Pontivivens marinum TaxID=1690039 RepID=A0A2C9CWT8_9RHOB|nr:Rne/Rng family ribonuclease [Monaibacterium marinum]SOH95585.1 ribonuclease E [Monaibacterium marinum]